MPFESIKEDQLYDAQQQEAYYSRACFAAPYADDALSHVLRLYRKGR
jgi:hypothetical protein